MAVGRAGEGGRERRLIQVTGLVQGVGFRPFVYREALAHGLTGWVANGPAGVTVDVEGPTAAVEHFVRALAAKAPAQARVEGVSWRQLPPSDHRGFEIRASFDAGAPMTLVSPDLATCPDCLRELFDPADRRHRYPFINCTNCGPRYSIIDALPYDRAVTTMRGFNMCPTCAAEYEAPADRRFHAQPDACADCGPRVWFSGPRTGATDNSDAAIAAAVVALRAGGIVAVKGLAGFQLACDAGSAAAVTRLRAAKARPAKPLALMVADLAAARAICRVNATEAALLGSPRAPIVLLDRRLGAATAAGGAATTDDHETPAIAPAVAPGQLTLGVMLPATPLHHLLLRQFGRPLVMTSGNASEEPLAATNEEALTTLATIADGGFLLHDRPIAHRADDSVTRVVAGRTLVIRRARGCAPAPLPFTADPQVGDVIACGGQEKAAFCVTRAERAFLSHHTGELGNARAFDFYQESLDHYRALFAPVPGAVVSDLHPDYASSRLAARLAIDWGARLISVQHHHAHIAAAMGEHRLTGPVIGVAYDGTGLGDDGTLWGGEVLLCDRAHYRRFAHLQPFPLPGGDLAVRRPYRTAYGILASAGEPVVAQLPGVDIHAARALVAQTIPADELAALDFQLRRGVNAPLTSSIGRLFDAAAVICGFSGCCSYDAEAAIWLEALAGPLTANDESAPYNTCYAATTRRIDGAALLSAMAADTALGLPPATVAQRFHATLADATRTLCLAARRETGIADVCLSGGVFMNRRLLVLTERALVAAGFRVFVPQEAPLNDGGLAYGQAIVARAQLSITVGGDAAQGRG